MGNGARGLVPAPAPTHPLPSFVFRRRRQPGLRVPLGGGPDPGRREAPAGPGTHEVPAFIGLPQPFWTGTAFSFALPSSTTTRNFTVSTL
jgi:hypothetical protein